MTKENILNRVCNCMVNFDIENSKSLVKEAIKKGIPPLELLEAMTKGMDIVGKKYEAKEYYLPELMMAGETMKAGMEELAPYLKAEKVQSTGKVVIGTVKGDVHTVGKSIVITLLLAAGFEVLDLGTDTPAETFVEKAKEFNADIVGMSALVSTTVLEIKPVIDALNEAGLREKLKIIVGGRAVSEKIAEEFGADAAARDAMHGIQICKEWMTAK